MSLIALVRLLFLRLPGYRFIRRSMPGAILEAVPSTFCLCWQVCSVDPHKGKFADQTRGRSKPLHQPRQHHFLSRCRLRILCWLFNVQCVWAAPSGLPAAIAAVDAIVSELPERSNFASVGVATEDRDDTAAPECAGNGELLGSSVPKHCVLYQAGFPAQHLLVYAKLPCTVSAFIQDASDLARDSAKDHILVPTRPQLCTGIATLVAVPRWSEETAKTVYVLDFSHWQGPVYAVLTWRHVTLDSLAADARRYVPGPWQDDHHSLSGPLLRGQVVQAAPGDVFTFRDTEALPKSSCLLDHMIADHASWDPCPPVIPRERPSHQWLAMRSHVFRTPPFSGTNVDELKSIAAEAFDSEVGDLEFELVGHDSTLQELVYEGSSIRGVLAAVPRSLSGKRHGAFVFLDTRLIGRQPSFRFCTPGWVGLRDLFDFIDYPTVPSGFKLEVQGVTSHGNKVFTYDGCTVVLKLTECGLVAAAAQPSTSVGGFATDGNARGSGLLGSGSHLPRRYERDAPPSPDPENLLQANPRAEEPDTLTELVSAWFLVFAPRFQHECYQLEITVPCTVDHALEELAEVRDSGCSEFFTELIPAFPQPDASFGTVIAVPPWAGECCCVLVDARAFDNRLYSTVFRGRLNRKSVLLHLHIPDEADCDLYCGRSLLTDDAWRNFLPGETITVKRRGDAQTPPISLIDMLQHGSDWAPQVQSFHGPHFPAFCVLSDGGYKVILVDVEEIKSFSDFKRLSAETFQHSSGHVNVCSSMPRVNDLAVDGQACKAILVATETVRRIQIPPGRLQLMRTIVFLDCRLLLRDFAWVAADQGRLDVDLLVADHSDGIPDGYCINVKGASTEIRAGHTFLWVPQGTLLTFTLVEVHPSSSPTSDQDSDSDLDSGDSTAPGDDDAGSGHDATDIAPANAPTTRASSRSRSPPRGDTGTHGTHFSRKIAPFLGSLRIGCPPPASKIPGIPGDVVSDLLAASDYVASQIGCPRLPETAFFLHYAKGIVNAKILDEPKDSTPLLDEAIAFLRYAAPRLGGAWRYNVPATARHIVPDSDDESSEETAETLSTMHFLVLSPGFAPKHIVIQLSSQLPSMRHSGASKLQDSTRTYVVSLA